MIPVEQCLNVVQAVRGSYPTPLGANHAQFLLEVARALKCGLLKKDTGTFIVLPDGTKVAQDIVFDLNTATHYDILFDGENIAAPVFDSDGPMDTTRYYPVAQDGSETTPSVPPVGEPPPGDESPLDAILTKLRADMDNAHGRIAQLEANDQVYAQAVNELRGRVEQLEQRPSNGVELPALEVRFKLLGQTLTLPVTVKR